MARGRWSVALMAIGVCNVVSTFSLLDDPVISVNDVTDLISVQKDSSITFVCDFDYRENDHFSIQTGGRIIWKKNDQAVAELSNRTGREPLDDRYILSMGTAYYGSFAASFQITSLVAEDQGLYSCLVENAEYTDPSNDLGLTVEYPPSSEYPQCSVHSVGDDKTLVCKSERGSPHVSLQWTKDGQPLQQTVDDDGDNFIEIYTTVAGQDAISMRRYECSMTYKERSTGSCFLDRPSVLIPTSTSGLAIGEDLEVVCLAYASDNPQVSEFRWKINPNRHHMLTNNGAVLHFSNITSHDNGTEIICEGQNAMGLSTARSVIVLRPIETPPTPITVELEQTEIPVVGKLARFQCRTTPQRSSEWLYKGLHIDPSDSTDRFFVEGRLNDVLAVGDITREDDMALVTCYVTVSNRAKAEMHLKVNFTLTTNSPHTLPAETSKQEPYPQPTTTRAGISTSRLQPAVPKASNPVTPKLDTSQSEEDTSFSNDQIIWYVVGSLMCIVLVGICCWVSLKATSLMCDRDTKSDSVPTSPTTLFRRIDEDFVVRVALPGEVTPSSPTDQSQLTKEQLVAQEVQYQELDEVSRQRQTNEYQRLISDVWMPPPLPLPNE